MRASILIVGLALMAVYIVHCEGFTIDTVLENENLIRVKRDDDTATPAPAPGAPAGGAADGAAGSDAKPADTKDSKNNTAIHLGSSSFQTMQFVVLPIVAAKIMM